MCVGLSAKVVRISDGTAVVDAGGAKRSVSSELLEDLEPGDYVPFLKRNGKQKGQNREIRNFSVLPYFSKKQGS